MDTDAYLIFLRSLSDLQLRREIQLRALSGRTRFSWGLVDIALAVLHQRQPEERREHENHKNLR